MTISSIPSPSGIIKVSLRAFKNQFPPTVKNSKVINLLPGNSSYHKNIIHAIFIRRKSIRKIRWNIIAAIQEGNSDGIHIAAGYSVLTVINSGVVGGGLSRSGYRIKTVVA